MEERVERFGNTFRTAAEVAAEMTLERWVELRHRSRGSISQGWGRFVHGCVLAAFLPRSLCSLASWGYLGLGCLLTLWAENTGCVSCPVLGGRQAEQGTMGSEGSVI